MPLFVNITPLGADQFTRVVRCFITVEFFRLMSGDEQETVTRQDLTEFRTFLLEQLKYHTSELSSKFEKAWVFSGSWVVLEADISVLLSCLLGFRLLLAC